MLDDVVVFCQAFTCPDVILKISKVQRFWSRRPRQNATLIYFLKALEILRVHVVQNKTANVECICKSLKPEYVKYILLSYRRLISKNEIKIMFTTVFTLKILGSKNSYYSFGRWNVAKSIDDQHLQVDLANHDHCGPCALPSKR